MEKVPESSGGFEEAECIIALFYNARTLELPPLRREFEAHCVLHDHQRRRLLAKRFHTCAILTFKRIRRINKHNIRRVFCDHICRFSRNYLSGRTQIQSGKVLANLLAGIRYGGAVAACGLAASMSLPTTVAPFILRGVSLLGVDSVMAPEATRHAAWEMIARSAANIPFERIMVRHKFSEVAELAPLLLDQKLRGRVILSW